MLVDKQNELMSVLLFTVHQHGGDDVTWKPPIDSFFVSTLQDASGYAISSQNNLELHLGCHLLIELFYIGMPVVRMDGLSGERAGVRSVGRCTVTWLPNFLGWVDYFICLPMVLRARELRYDLTNLISGSIDLFTDTAAIFN